VAPKAVVFGGEEKKPSSAPPKERPFTKPRDYMEISEKSLKEVMESFIASYVNPDGTYRDPRQNADKTPKDPCQIEKETYSFHEVLLRIAQERMEKDGKLDTPEAKENFIRDANKVSRQMYQLADDFMTALGKRKGEGPMTDRDILDTLRKVFFEDHRFRSPSSHTSREREYENRGYDTYNPNFLEVCLSHQGICEDLMGPFSAALNILWLRGYDPPIAPIMLPTLGNQTHTVLRMKRNEAKDPLDKRKNGIYLELTADGGKIQTHEEYLADILERRKSRYWIGDTSKVTLNLSPSHWLIHPLAAVSAELANQAVTVVTKKDLTEADLGDANHYLEWAARLSPNVASHHFLKGNTLLIESMGLHLFKMPNFNENTVTHGFRCIGWLGPNERLENVDWEQEAQNNYTYRAADKTFMGRLTGEGEEREFTLWQVGDDSRRITLVAREQHDRPGDFDMHKRVPVAEEVEMLRKATGYMTTSIGLHRDPGAIHSRGQVYQRRAKLTEGEERVDCLVAAAVDFTDGIGRDNPTWAPEVLIMWDIEKTDHICGLYDQAFNDTGDTSHLESKLGVWDRLKTTYDLQERLEFSYAYLPWSKADVCVEIGQHTQDAEQRKWFSKAYGLYGQARKQIKADHALGEREWREDVAAGKEHEEEYTGIISWPGELTAYEGFINLKLGRLMALGGKPARARKCFSEAARVLGYTTSSTDDILAEYARLEERQKEQWEKPEDERTSPSGPGEAVGDTKLHNDWDHLIKPVIQEIHDDPQTRSLLEEALKPKK